MSKPRWFQVLTEEQFDGFCKKHICGFHKNIFRFESCDVVCQEGLLDPYHIQPHVQVTTLFDVNAIPLDHISNIFDCFQIQSSGIVGTELVALRPWRDCLRSTDGCHRHVHRITSKFCSFTCKMEHVLEQEGDLSSIYKSWSGDKLREVSEHFGDLSIHPCGDPEKIYPFKKEVTKKNRVL